MTAQVECYKLNLQVILNIMLVIEKIEKFIKNITKYKTKHYLILLLRQIMTLFISASILLTAVSTQYLVHAGQLGDDFVAVALVDQEPLPFGGVMHLHCVL